MQVDKYYPLISFKTACHLVTRRCSFRRSLSLIQFDDLKLFLLYKKEDFGSAVTKVFLNCMTS